MRGKFFVSVRLCRAKRPVRSWSVPAELRPEQAVAWKWKSKLWNTQDKPKRTTYVSLFECPDGPGSSRRRSKWCQDRSISPAIPESWMQGPTNREFFRAIPEVFECEFG